MSCSNDCPIQLHVLVLDPVQIAGLDLLCSKWIGLHRSNDFFFLTLPGRFKEPLPLVAARRIGDSQVSGQKLFHVRRIGRA